MNKLSLKIGTYILILALCIETIAFVSFYKSLTKMRIDEETTALLDKGNRYRNFIERRYGPRAFEHATAMESHSNSNTKIVITDTNGQILSSSDPVTKDMEKQLACKVKSISRNGTMIEKNWKSSKFISTASPIIVHKQLVGYVHMFLDTAFLEKMILRLTHQFIIIGILTLLLTTISVFIFSRVITDPLIKMKRATEKMLKLNKPIKLGIKRNDELGSLAKTIEELSSELAYMKKERNEFLASVAHELLTPLTYMKGYAKVAKRDSLSKEEREEYLQIIEDETDSVTELIQDLFDLAQLEQHQFIIKKQKIPLQPFLERMIEKTKPALAKKQIKIKFHCIDNPNVCMDERRMEQVMLNLLHNAYQHSYEQSVITVQASQNENTFSISVQDEGEGIPREDIPHIFDRFYRVDKSRTRATGGKGIGLAVAKEIVELHSGSIQVKSELGMGAEFIIKLPIE
ncbi:HAMP domain-containing sensor histidine kinase [Bacillus pseudomycoides]|uniref:HAMP domain-containing sensor histidine kinase n=1 Tax=Bacillus pseudomycoides TaxID=64104 RepID=UPI000BEB7856|nr:HAMP domain-containing sensor histidine kinase [Bacillus pseudomycoides]PED07512.1 two-component sensor histidine kinase [Bacillus pseudomycoides]PEI96660.1 two-component sensor histidine kinase [Bacillus pseudomycoides]PEK26781.1 two-component sensor histidine kinase [Bacillus pseudomycoides]PEM75273.1 two-component sensor histidine kinase [Bacillus pseudomycoides]PEO17632.1 two-component sensor histidine kinase [Bacillus pseudomycoides]